MSPSLPTDPDRQTGDLDLHDGPRAQETNRNQLDLLRYQESGQQGQTDVLINANVSGAFRVEF